jgi:calcineurin-like phosphoesterase family protein
MSKTWVIADPHFGHWGVCKFLREDGSKLRPWDNPDDMDRDLINNWNDIVSEKDRVYVLGDVCINRRSLVTLGRLYGRKVLVKGNHDIFQLKDYLPYFDDIRACVVKKNKDGNKVILTHIPIHPDSLGRFGINIHGHLHSNRVLDDEGNIDPRYICVSVEHTDFKPLDLMEAFNMDLGSY